MKIVKVTVIPSTIKAGFKSLRGANGESIRITLTDSGFRDNEEGYLIDQEVYNKLLTVLENKV